jgi:hypothetical protein
VQIAARFHDDHGLVINGEIAFLGFLIGGADPAGQGKSLLGGEREPGQQETNEGHEQQETSHRTLLAAAAPAAGWPSHAQSMCQPWESYGFEASSVNGPRASVVF